MKLQIPQEDKNEKIEFAKDNTLELLFATSLQEKKK